MSPSHRNCGQKISISSLWSRLRRLHPIACVVLLAGILDVGGEIPRRGGTLRLWNSTDWRSLDPAIAFDAESTPIQKLLFRGLLNYGDGVDLVPDQASDWNVSADGKTYTFHLRPGVKFAHGREVEAEDYVFAIERILDPNTGSAGQSYFLDIVGAPEFSRGKTNHVAGLRTPGPSTLVIELSRPAFVFRYVMAMNFANAVPRELVQQHGRNFRHHLVGSGPYLVTEWRRDVRYRFERNPHYSGTDGWVDAVEIIFGADASVASMMLERGELDRVLADAPTRNRFEKDPRLRAQVHRVTPTDIGYLFLNTEMEPFDDLRVRQAVSHALDVPRLARLTAGQCIVAEGIVPATMSWSNPDLPRHEFNPERSRELLRDAGLPDGFKTELWFIRSRNVDQRMAEGIQQDLAAVGITINLKPASYPAFEVKVRGRRQVPCGIWGWVQDYPDPSTFLDTLLNGERISESDGNNQAFYNNSEVNRRLAEAARIVDSGRRTQLFREAEVLTMRDAPWVPLYHEQYPVIRSSRLRGNVPHPVWLWRYENMWLAE